jgi:drug/metabolite transporter (DMT)-like permease
VKKDTLAYLYALSAALLWGTTAAAVKLLGIKLDSIQILFYTTFIASLSLFIIAAFQKRLSIVRSYKTKDYFRFSYMSLLGVFLYYTLLYAALQEVPGQEAFIVNYTWPIWVIIFAAFVLRERLDLLKLLAIILAFLGVVIVVSKGNIHNVNLKALHGNILALLAAISYGLFSVLSKRNDYEKVTSTMFYYLFAFVYVSIYILFFSSLPLPTGKEILGLLWLGVFTSGLAFVLWQLALKYGETSKVSNLIFITPFLSLLYLAILTGEHIILSSIIGAVLIVSGLAIQSLKNKTADSLQQMS